MKKTLFLLLLAAALTTACSKQSRGSGDVVTRQNNGAEDNPNGGGGANVSSVPSAVGAAFAARYPDAAKVQWKLLSNDNYKAEFYRGTVKWQTNFTASGVLVKEEHD